MSNNLHYDKEPMPNDTAYKALFYIAGVLDENNIEYCISWGTLLGLVRDGQIIEGDDDIDIQINSKDFYKILELMSKEGVQTIVPTCVPVWGKVDLKAPLCLIQAFKNIEGVNCCIDFYPFLDDGSDFVKMYCFGKQDPKEKKDEDKTCIHIPKDKYFPLMYMYVEGRRIKVPYNPEFMLEFNYGNNWTKKLETHKDYKWEIENFTPKITYN